MGKQVLISARGNFLRVLVMYLDHISWEETAERNIPTGVPLVYHLGEQSQAADRYYLENEGWVAAKTQAVIRQGKKK